MENNDEVFYELKTVYFASYNMLKKNTVCQASTNKMMTYIEGKAGISSFL
mgnify:FL=1